MFKFIGFVVVGLFVIAVIGNITTTDKDREESNKMGYMLSINECKSELRNSLETNTLGVMVAPEIFKQKYNRCMAQVKRIYPEFYYSKPSTKNIKQPNMVESNQRLLNQLQINVGVADGIKGKKYYAGIEQFVRKHLGMAGSNTDTFITVLTKDDVRLNKTLKGYISQVKLDK